jgi:hypothetical protein
VLNWISLYKALGGDWQQNAGTGPVAQSETTRSNGETR